MDASGEELNTVFLFHTIDFWINDFFLSLSLFFLKDFMEYLTDKTFLKCYY